MSVAHQHLADGKATILRHFESLGGASIIVVTNSDHTRAAGELKAMCGAELVGPSQEKSDFPIPCDRPI